MAAVSFDVLAIRLGAQRAPWRARSGEAEEITQWVELTRR